MHTTDGDRDGDDSPDVIRVLHVDDDPDFPELVAEFLRRADDRFEVVTASSASAALERLAGDDRGIDCVVSDYEMPETDGLEFLEAVREDLPDIPFVLFTGKGSEEIASEAISRGVTDYLGKGAGTDQYELLANRVSNAVEQYRARKQATKQERVSRVVRRVTEALVQATSREEIDRHVCEVISDAAPYRFAWIGEVDRESRTLEPRAAAGIDRDYLAEITVTIDETSTGLGPGGTAARERRFAVSQDVVSDPAFEPWREDALERGYQAVAAIPLEYDGTLHGVLCVYADRPHAFDEDERAVLSELGDSIAHAYHRVAVQEQYEAQYRELFEDAPVMVAFTRPVEGEPVIEDCNRQFAETLGYEREALHGEPLASVYTEESRRALLAEGGYERALAGEFVRERRSFLTRDGERVETLLRATPRRDTDGEVIGTHALYVDVTERDRVAAVERRNERLEEFANILSHDLRNPLGVARGRLELAREAIDAGEDPDEHLAAVERAHDRIETLIDDLLVLARTGEAVAGMEPVDLAALVESCWATVETDGARLVVDADWADRAVRADESRLRQLLENLFRNSVEHSSTGSRTPAGDSVEHSSTGSRASPDDSVEHSSTGSRTPSGDSVEHSSTGSAAESHDANGGADVTVTVGMLPDGAGFYVADDGPGIPPDDRETVFESGYSTADSGTGFGLSIVSTVAEAHGWTVEVTESDADGARFEFTGVETVPG